METKHHTIKLLDDSIAEVTIIGDGDTEVAKQFVKDAEKMFAESNIMTVDAIVDMSKSGFSNLGGIDIYRDFLKSEKLGKIAFVGANIGVRAMIELATSDRKKPSSFFDTKDEALRWIKGQ